MKKDNEEYEIVKIDHDELHKQLEEQATKATNSIHFKTFVGGDMDNPVAKFIVGKDATGFQMIQMMCVLKNTLEELIKEYPELYAEALDTKIRTNIVTEDKKDIDEI